MAVFIAGARHEVAAPRSRWPIYTCLRLFMPNRTCVYLVIYGRIHRRRDARGRRAARGDGRAPVHAHSYLFRSYLYLVVPTCACLFMAVSIADVMGEVAAPRSEMANGLLTPLYLCLFILIYTYTFAPLYLSYSYCFISIHLHLFIYTYSY